jgi:acyl-CoA dehydrogenase
MRGTESHGYKLSAQFPEDYILSAPFSEILNKTMLPYSHIYWSAVWYGIARRAVKKTTSALRQSGKLSNANSELAKISFIMERWRSREAQAMNLIVKDSEDDLVAQTHRTSTLNGLKVEASEAARRVVLGCLDISGFASYSNLGPVALGLEVRDILSAPLMVSNFRLRDSMAEAAALSIRRQVL